MTKLYKSIDSKDTEQYAFVCPACGICHMVRVRGHAPLWTIAGLGTDSPTVSPSIIVHGTSIAENLKFVCHLYIRDGNIEYLNDCMHKFAGKTVPMVDFSYGVSKC